MHSLDTVAESRTKQCFVTHAWVVAALLGRADPGEGWESPGRRRIIELGVGLELLLVAEHPIDVDIRPTSKCVHIVGQVMQASGGSVKLSLDDDEYNRRLHSLVSGDHAVALWYRALRAVAGAILAQPARAVVIYPEGDVVQAQRVVNRQGRECRS